MTTDRAPISKRLRYEILRRDNHTCRYCGAAAPDVVLTVDHVVPVALGGQTDPTNLVTACKDCNAGKTSTSPSDRIVADVSDDAMRWAEAMRQAAASAVASTTERNQLNGQLYDLWQKHTPEGHTYEWPLPPDFDASLDHFRRVGLPQSEIVEAFWVMHGKPQVNRYDRWRYFCGICNRKITDLQAAARTILDNPDGAL